MPTKVTWFRHNHENRNDLLRFGLMRLHYAGSVNYIERPFADAVKYGFSTAITTYPDPRHLSFLLVEQQKAQIRVMVDNEDSFALISPLLKEVDLCFCAGYNSDFFERKQFVNKYNWQSDADVVWYRKAIAQKINNLGDHFHKIRRFIPIAPNLSTNYTIPQWKQKLRNLEHKLSGLTNRGSNFQDVYRMFELRYDYLLSLRDLELKHDITLNDSLWGWPQHRINLHQQLKELSTKGYDIRSILKWNEPVAHDGSDQLNINKCNFPMVTGPINRSYEEMLAQSKLAVFACGFHWGWRNIMTLALMTGIPVLTDRLLTEAYFDMSEFELTQAEDHNWSTIQEHFGQLDNNAWQVIKTANQKVYDRYMAPEVVAQYFLRTIEN